MAELIAARQKIIAGATKEQLVVARALAATVDYGAADERLDIWVLAAPDFFKALQSQGYVIQPRSNK